MNAYSPPAHISAVLGATNTGKTHYAVERMLARTSGVIGLPLRLLAREIYDRIINEKGPASCALVTGEEQIVPAHARYFVCTAEAMPMDDIKAGKFACVVIDEVQMMAHKERGHIFTNRLLHARGTEETLFLGADTARPIIEALVPEARFVTRERFSVLSYSGHTKLTRLPKRSVVVAFSSDEVYAIAEIMRRNYGGAALVMGALSPRTRNAQAALYQSGEVDYMVATDAIGMGLNLDADHVAFASLRKFDGERRRYLRASEVAQIAGRAGRFRRDGTFGTTGKCLPLDDDIAIRIENHSFEPLKTGEWRNPNLDMGSAEALLQSLALGPDNRYLRRIAPAPDELALGRLLGTHEIEQDLKSPADVKSLWDVCQIPDFRNLGPEAHARMLEDIYTKLRTANGPLSDEYLERNIKRLNYTEGGAEILSSRLSSIRTWTYIAHKQHWVGNTENWIKRAREVEDNLSDALHEKLVQRFVDRRTSALLKGIGAKTQMDATVNENGEVIAEGHLIGQLNGLLFVPDESASDTEAKALQKTAALALAPEIDRRLTQISGCDQNALALSDQGEILWNGAAVGKIIASNEFLKPQVTLIGGKLGSPVLSDLAHGRLRDFVNNEINQKFESLFALKALADDPQSFQGARGLANVLFENHGMIFRREYLQMVKDTDKTARGYLRNKSAKFGFYHVFLTDLLKPAPARLMSLLFAFAWDKEGGGDGKPFLPPNGMSSTPNDAQYSEEGLNKAGYTRCGPRLVRFDILSRLAELILQAMNTRGDRQFRIAQEMMSLLGCSFEEMEQVLESIGYFKTEIELSPEDFELEKQRILEMHSRQAVKEGAAAEPKEEPVQPEEASKDGETKASETPTETPHVPKRQRVKPINDYISKPEIDENNDPIFPTTVSVWKRNARRHYNPVRSVSRASEPQSRSASQSARNRTDKFKAYSNMGDGSGARSNKQRRAAKKSNNNDKNRWTAAPASKQKDNRVEDSPFAALAALKMSAGGSAKKGKKDKDD